MERLLVMRGGALGDFVLGLPALQALRAAFLAAELELIAPAAVLPLAYPWVDRATALEMGEIASLFGDDAELPENIVARNSDLDLAVLWLADADGIVRRNLERLGTRRVLWAPALPQQPGIHAMDHLLATLAPLLVSREAANRSPLSRFALPTQPTVLPGGRARAVALACRSKMGLAGSAPVVAIHPGSGGLWKCWPAQMFAELSNRLRASGRRVVLLQGPADGEIMRRVYAAIPGDLPMVLTGLGVEELAAFLSTCSAYLGNDSGVTHLASAVGTPTVAIFGPTDPCVWGPRGPKVVTLRTRQDCAPCSRQQAVSCMRRACLMGITVDQVVDALDGVVMGYREPTRL